MTYQAEHVFSDGTRVRGPASVVSELVGIDRDYRTAEREWVARLRVTGIKLAHPDDGWVNREENSLVPCYPQFDDNPGEGDLIALGSWKVFRLVRVTRVQIRLPLLSGMTTVRYFFEESPDD
jgi:hypothetical protein